MKTIYSALFLAFLVGCGSDPVNVELPEINWTEGETSTDDAPETGEFKVLFETTVGEFTVLVHREWAPRGAERFYQLIQNNYFDGSPFYRVVPGFIVQFGMNGDPKGTRYWDKSFPDDPVVQSNMAGLVCFAKAGPNTRSTQIFVNFGLNSRLDDQGFAPFAEVIDGGMSNVSKINPEYLEEPNQARMARSGNAYVFSKFPNIDYIIKATLVDAESDVEPKTSPDEKGQ